MAAYGGRIKEKRKEGKEGTEAVKEFRKEATKAVEREDKKEVKKPQGIEERKESQLQDGCFLET